MENHETHSTHEHDHTVNCGHFRIRHNGHTDYLHDGHLHFRHDDHYDEHVLEVSASNPAGCRQVSCECLHDDCGHESIRHGDHMDHVYEGTLHFRHNDHCDDHGKVSLI